MGDPSGAVQLARKPNYDFEKRRKEMDRKAKKEEKLRRKREQAAGRADEAAQPAPAEEAESERE